MHPQRNLKDDTHIESLAEPPYASWLGVALAENPPGVLQHVVSGKAGAKAKSKAKANKSKSKATPKVLKRIARRFSPKKPRSAPEDAHELHPEAKPDKKGDLLDGMLFPEEKGVPLVLHPQKQRAGRYNYTVHGKNNKAEKIVIEVHLANESYYVKSKGSAYKHSRTCSWGRFGGAAPAWAWLEGELDGWIPDACAGEAA